MSAIGGKADEIAGKADISTISETTPINLEHLILDWAIRLEIVESRQSVGLRLSL
jgi:hypothetical protein